MIGDVYRDCHLTYVILREKEEKSIVLVQGVEKPFLLWIENWMFSHLQFIENVPLKGIEEEAITEDTVKTTLPDFDDRLYEDEIEDYTEYLEDNSILPEKIKNPEDLPKKMQKFISGDNKKMEFIVSKIKNYYNY